MKRKRFRTAPPVPEPLPKTELPLSQPAPVVPVMPRWSHAIVLLALLAANLALYYPALRLEFLSVDDPDYVQNNPYIDSFSASNLNFIFTRPYTANYAPANLLSYAVDAHFSRGKRPFAFHLSSVLWHGCVVGMVYFLAFTLRPRVIPAAAAAALFLFHPAHVEAVAWISSRKDLVATCFAVLSMICYLRARAGPGTAAEQL